jgi:ribosome-binding protein aMBF1 (putative translation factor)
MKRNLRLDSIRKTISPDVKREIDLSFEIADRIYEILKKQGKSHLDLAAALGKKESEISKWFRGTHNFTTQTIARIACALGEQIILVAGTRK